MLTPRHVVYGVMSLVFVGVATLYGGLASIEHHVTDETHVHPEISWMEIHDRRWIVQVATTPFQRTLHVKNRMDMGNFDGHLSIHSRPLFLAESMEDVLIPLDLLYFSADGELVQAHYRAPPCRMRGRCPTFDSEGLSLYVLRMEAGQAEALRLEPGARIRLPPELLYPPHE